MTIQQLLNQLMALLPPGSSIHINLNLFSPGTSGPPGSTAAPTTPPPIPGF